MFGSKFAKAHCPKPKYTLPKGMFSAKYISSHVCIVGNKMCV